MMASSQLKLSWPCLSLSVQDWNQRRHAKNMFQNISEYLEVFNHLKE